MKLLYGEANVIITAAAVGTQSLFFKLHDEADMVISAASIQSLF